MKHAAITLALMLPLCAAAQYKCQVNGKTEYSDLPCSSTARYVGELQDNLPREQQIQRLQQSIKERQQRNHIEARNDRDFRASQNAIERQAQIEASQAASAESARQRRCANLQHELKWNQRGVARYQDFGWQRSLTQQEQEMKRNQEAYDRECR